MDQDKNTNFSLLNQEEIDTLVRFLTEKKNTVDSDIMSQTSIDKLIKLIQTDREHLVLHSFNAKENVDLTFLQNIHFRTSKEELCELRFSTNSDTNYIELFIDNKDTGVTTQLSPKLFNAEDSDEWGYTIPPALFSQIATTLSLKFTQDTYDSICSIFAKHNFGSVNQKIPEIYLPENSNLVACLL